MYKKQTLNVLPIRLRSQLKSFTVCRFSKRSYGSCFAINFPKRYALR